MGMITIGRASDNIISLFNDKEISRKHSKITYEAGNFIVEDQNSLNGTFVNNQRIEGPRYLEDGDVIFIGVSTLEYHQS
jgi:pSer/pThr/pTyr-binding forkhead associated (FHA) protein